MKSATIPPLRVTPKLRQDAQSVSNEEVMESLGSFLKSSPPVQSLEQLLDGITPENIHDEIETGATVGKEIW